jgi:hypothetical protein
MFTFAHKLVKTDRGPNETCRLAIALTMSNIEHRAVVERSSM